jgi:hypothetical protein
VISAECFLRSASHAIGIAPDALEGAIPDRLKKAVAEAKRENVLRRLLPQKVVNAEDLIVIEDLVQLTRSAIRRS